MSRDRPNANSPDSELHKLLRETTGASPVEKTSRAAHPAKTSEPADLHALLREGSSATPNVSPRELRSTQAPPGPSLQELLRAPSGKVNKGLPPRRAPDVAQSKASGELDQVLRQVHGNPAAAEAPQRTAPTARRTATVDFGQALLSHSPVTKEPDESDASRPGLTPSRWFARTGWVTAGLLAIGVALWWPQRQLPGTPGTLQSLAKAVEKHRNKSGHLPDHLAKLEAFPRDAVEWPVQYWNARDAAGRTEIIWVPQGSRHYRIVIRQGAEIWIYSDLEGRPRLATKGGK